MNKVTVAEVKRYLGLDGEEQNELLAAFLAAAGHTMEKVLRNPIGENTPETCRTAILYCVWQYYFHRDNDEFKANELENTLAVMLSDIRKAAF